MPAMVMVPLRAEADVFAATEYVSEPEPVPDLALVMVIQLALLVAVQEAVDGVAVMATLPLPPEDEKLAEVGFSEKDALAAACVTVKLFPATLTAPERCDVELFDATEYFTWPLPVPELGLDSVIQLVAVDALQAHPVCVVTLNE
jgi:hypothetical protein